MDSTGFFSFFLLRFISKHSLTPLLLVLLTATVVWTLRCVMGRRVLGPRVLAFAGLKKPTKHLPILSINKKQCRIYLKISPTRSADIARRAGQKNTGSQASHLKNSAQIKTVSDGCAEQILLRNTQECCVHASTYG